MEKINGFDEAQAFGESRALPAGGHKCIIKDVELCTASNGKEYLKLKIDINEGDYKNYYQTKYDLDTRAEKKWSGVWAIFLKDFTGEKTNSKFKGLITSVESSNDGFKWNWEEKTLKDKKVGIVFREEEFMGTDGLHSTAKPFYAVAYENAFEQKIPNPKTLATEVADEKASDDLPF